MWIYVSPTDVSSLSRYREEKQTGIQTSAHQQMRESEREPFYDDIAHVIQNTKKIIPPVGFEPETVKHLAA